MTQNIDVEMRYFIQWIKDAVSICFHEIKRVMHDSGVMIIFTVAGFGYPILYNVIYHNGILEDTPIAVVDESHSAESRRYIRKVDATRELRVERRCASMAEAEEMMRERKVKGVVYFPEDFGNNIKEGLTANLSIYADMSSFLYYKNLMMGVNFVMLNEMEQIKIERYSGGGMTDQEISQLIEAIPYDENNPYNRTFSYSIFFLSAALLLIIQQAMFYGMTMQSGSMYEFKRDYPRLIMRLRGKCAGRVIAGRGAAYWLLFMIIGVYIAFIVPAIFSFPQRGTFGDIFVMLALYVADCVFFSLTWSSFFRKRETVLVALLFMSPIAMFLTGFSWPVTAFPTVWRLFSFIFPSTFACPCYINLNTAGCELSQVTDLIRNMAIQTEVYAILATIAVMLWQRRYRRLGIVR